MGILLALLSSGMWGTADFVAGELSRRRAALAVVGAAQIIGLGFMLVVATATGAWWAAIPVGDYLVWAALASIAGIIGLGSFYTALASGRMGVVSPIAALGVLVPLAAGLLQGDQPTPVQLVGIVIAICGVVLASGPEVSGGVGLKPLLLACLAALMFGLFLVFVAYGSQASAVLTMTSQRMVSATIAVIAVLVLRSVGGLQRSDGPRLLLIGVFDVSANLLFGLATTFGLLAIISVLGSLYPVVTVVLAWLVLKERLLPAQTAGIAAAFAGVAMISGGGAL